MKRLRRLGVASLKAAATVGVLWLILRSVDLERAALTASSADARLIGCAVAMTGVLNLIKPVRWLWLLRGVLPDASYGTALRSHLFAVGARLVLPGKLGELGRVLDIPQLPVARGVGVALLDLVLDICTGCLVAVPGAYLVGGPAAAGAVAAVSLALLGLAFRPTAILTPLSRTPGLRRLRTRVAGAREVMDALGSGPLVAGFAVSVALHAVRFGQLWLLIVALGAQPGAMALWVLPVVPLAEAVAFTVGGIGVREGLAVAVLPAFGVPPEVALAAVFLQYVVTNLVPGVVGGWVVYKRRHVAAGKLRSVIAAAPD